MRYIGINDSSFYVTHAPCANKYLGKIDPDSLKNQRNFRLDRERELEKQLQFIKDEAVGNHPIHVFGHIASANGFRLGNKICIDAGAVYGHRLKGVSISRGRLFFKSVPSISNQKEELPVLFEKTEASVSIDDLGEEDRLRLEYVLKNKINYISGTISPADKCEKTGELESLAEGLAYFKSKGIQRVCMQPKYMGSRCTVYLGRTADECYAVSRNGFKIKNVNLTPIFEKLIHKHQAMMEKHKIQMMVIDGELVPWMALGKGLIERQFKVIDVALAEEIRFLKEYGFEEKLLALNEAYLRYHEQVELYGSESEMDFKPFDILKMIGIDGSETIPSDPKSVIFGMISEDECLVVDFGDPDYLDKEEAFYHALTTDLNMEGVVIKPEVEKPRVAPAIKVRNPEYLRIIYGYDYTFPHKYKSLFAQKSIRSKLKTSISEHELGRQMLAFPLSSITEDNRDYAQVVANMLFETSKESEIDPRL